MKRDDATGLAFGGNKTRKVEFILADALRQGADSVITWGGLQSNWCRQTVAASRMLGVRPILILSKNESSPPVHDGNLLLDRLMGAEIHFLEPGEDRQARAEVLAESERSAGNRPYVVAVGGSRTGGSMQKPIGALSYTEAFLEMVREAEAQKCRMTHIIHASGSGGTQAGLCVGARALAPHVKVVGISIGGAKAASQKNIAQISNDLAAALRLDIRFTAEEIIVFDDYVGGGYGILDRKTKEAIKVVAREQGILLDPVYTGKAMVGMMDLVKQGYFKPDDEVVFLHTGGTPALFPYRDELDVG
jgi:D-cysteine desulfhydrase family pyridoxal phosphate-dependent enzyme